VVVDVSVAVKWFLTDERDRFADSILDRTLRGGAYVPALFRWEIQNVLLMAERAKRITPSEVDDALEALRDMPIVVDFPGDRIFSGSEMQLARHYDLTPYDAAYLALAANRHAPLATTDAALMYAARDLGIVLLAP
jgi:predicted nucleic acid-binding protein